VLLAEVTKLVDEDFRAGLVFDNWYEEGVEKILHGDQFMHPDRLFEPALEVDNSK